jgi:hypothetical protein
MDKETKEIVDKVKEKLSCLYSTDLFTPEDQKLDSLTEACRELLIYMGYGVSNPTLPQIKINKQDDLIHLFYHYRNFYHPAEYNMGRMPIERDRATAKYFVLARMQNGTISKKVALKQCAQIIETVFKYESEFNFKFPITFSVFGQNKLGWVTEAALKIIERERVRESMVENEKRLEEYEKHYMDEERDTPFNDLDAILEKVKSNT